MRKTIVEMGPFKWYMSNAREMKILLKSVLIKPGLLFGDVLMIMI
jgi:hypothetical protein